jgi:hypothetical protein
MTDYNCFLNKEDAIIYAVIEEVVSTGILPKKITELDFEYGLDGKFNWRELHNKINYLLRKPDDWFEGET